MTNEEKIQFLKEKWKALIKIEKSLTEKSKEWHKDEVSAENEKSLPKKSKESPKKSNARTFALDGRIIGDFAEEIACICFGLTKENGKGYDALTKDNQEVEIKCRRHTKGHGFTISNNARYLLYFRIDPKATDLHLKLMLDGQITNEMRDKSFKYAFGTGENGLEYSMKIFVV